MVLLSYSIGISNEMKMDWQLQAFIRNGVNLYFKHVKEGMPDIECQKKKRKYIHQSQRGVLRVMEF